MMGMGIPELAMSLFVLAMSAVLVWPAARICGRLGYSPWLAALVLVPLGNLLLLWFLAFTEWPIERSPRRAS